MTPAKEFAEGTSWLLEISELSRMLYFGHGAQRKN
jgi:hypothetical protein